MTNQRESLFTPGAEYRVKVDIPPGLSSFRKGELLTFKSCGYSRYDDGYMYEFMTAGGELKTWFLHDSKGVDLADVCFERN